MANLAGRMVLIVEDEILIALELQDLLRDHGGTPLGPVDTVEKALALLAKDMPDAAILDLNIRRGRSYPIADVLRRNGVPFVFATGFGEAEIDERYRDCPTLMKPYDDSVLITTIAQLLSDKR